MEANETPLILGVMLATLVARYPLLPQIHNC